MSAGEHPTKGMLFFGPIRLYYRLSDAFYRAGLGDEDLHAGLFYRGDESTAEATHNLTRYLVERALEERPSDVKDPIFYDLGCGRGGLAIEAARNGFRVVAVNVSRTQLHAATRLAESKGLTVSNGDNAAREQIRFYLDDAECFDIGQRASVVTFSESIVHMNRRRALANAYDSLLPGGLLQLTDVDFARRTLRDKLIRLGVGVAFLSKFYPRESYGDLLGKIGFVDTEVVALDDLVRPMFEKMYEQLKTTGGTGILARHYGPRVARWIVALFGLAISAFKNRYGYYYVRARKPISAREPGACHGKAEASRKDGGRLAPTELPLTAPRSRLP